MNVTDLFVASIAFVLGLGASLAAIFNWHFFFQLPKAKGVEKRFGRRGARIFYTILGVILMAIGTAIAVGFGSDVG